MPRKKISPEHKKILVTIGKKIKELREMKGFTIQDAANELSMSRNGYSLMERGEIYFNISTLLKILDYYKADHRVFLLEL